MVSVASRGPVGETVSRSPELLGHSAPPLSIRTGPGVPKVSPTGLGELAVSSSQHACSPGPSGSPTVGCWGGDIENPLLAISVGHASRPDAGGGLSAVPLSDTRSGLVGELLSISSSPLAFGYSPAFP